MQEDSVFWERVLLADGSKYNLSGLDLRKYVWRKAGEEIGKISLHPLVKRGGSVMA